MALLVGSFDAGATDWETRRDPFLQRMRVVFGRSFVALPRFTAADPAELVRTLADREQVQGGDPPASLTWFERMTRVGVGVERLNDAL